MKHLIFRASLTLLLLLGCALQGIADDKVLVFAHPKANYYYHRGSVGVTDNGVRVEYVVVPKRASDFNGLTQLNIVCFLNRSRQMKTVVAIGFPESGQPVALEASELPGGAGWTSVGTNSAYEALWEAVMKQVGFR